MEGWDWFDLRRIPVLFPGEIDILYSSICWIWLFLLWIGFIFFLCLCFFLKISKEFAKSLRNNGTKIVANEGFTQDPAVAVKILKVRLSIATLGSSRNPPTRDEALRTSLWVATFSILLPSFAKKKLLIVGYRLSFLGEGSTHYNWHISPYKSKRSILSGEYKSFLIHAKRGGNALKRRVHVRDFLSEGISWKTKRTQRKIKFKEIQLLNRRRWAPPLFFLLHLAHHFPLRSNRGLKRLHPMSRHQKLGWEKEIL